MTHRANVFVQGELAGYLEEIERGKHYLFCYKDGYLSPPVSLTLPLSQKLYSFSCFPPFFDGLLPEGAQLESLLKHAKIDRDDLFRQLITVGRDLVGYVTVEEA